MIESMCTCICET